MARNVQRLNPASLPDAGALGYTQVVTCAPGRLVVVSGQVAWSKDDAPVPPGLAEQAALVVQNLGRALDAAGVTPDDVVSLRAFLVDLDSEKGQAVLPALVELFGGQAPALTAVGVTSLAAPDLLIEIEAIAVAS